MFIDIHIFENNMESTEQTKERNEESEPIIVSERDCDIFFSEITNPKSPNENLCMAANKYKSWICQEFENPSGIQFE
ncbi:hypothetical protein [Bacteroides sp. 519]|uniref:hypothetical protein n=1 Tax=Bacteroides sp. 519 TaxID=2302937 RepID=UPI0013D3E1E5|nr:hypothetical protein [Bacteroides sp. 519]NDV57930.1 hypothetical protein [Bacteroides sp. 519]